MTAADLYPIRRKSAAGQPAPKTSIERRCVECHASFLKLAPGATGERGIWDDWDWFCSIECYAVGHPDEAAHLVAVQPTRRVSTTCWGGHHPQCAVPGCACRCHEQLHCPLHNQPIGPPPARNCPGCREAITRTLGETPAPLQGQPAHEAADIIRDTGA